MRLMQEQSSDQSRVELQSSCFFLAEAVTVQLSKAGTARSRRVMGSGFLMLLTGRMIKLCCGKHYCLVDGFQSKLAPSEKGPAFSGWLV